VNRFAGGSAWVEGEYVPIGEARVPVVDQGFSRSDGTYDVVAVWNGAFFRLDDHLDRFERGMAKLRLRPPVERDALVRILAELVRLSELREAYVEMIVTRGNPLPGSRDPRLTTPRLLAYAVPYAWIVSPDEQRVGTHAVVVTDTDRIPVRSIDPTVKNFQWGDFSRALFEAYDRGASQAILTDGNGLITEGPGYNVFAVTGGRVVTAGQGVLRGITRQTVLELAREEGLDVHEAELPVAELLAADEVFLTSTAGGVMPVATLDGVRVGANPPGPVTRRLRERYWELHDDPGFCLPVEY
jgi:branched-subunit amino acid aminotransferase/4-amino-4-deoxychorismate lyase